jgi:glycosyltransferase involved in cell wall biosynthesis
MGARLPVMLFTETFELAGTERQLVELAKRLDRTRYEVIICCKFRQGPLLAQIENEGLEIVEIPLQSFCELNALKQLARLVKFMRKRRIQLLHTTGNLGNTFVALAGLLARVPAIITSRRDMGGLIPEKLRTIQRALCRSSQAVLVNARCIKERLIEEESISADKIEVIRNGIDFSRFEVAPDNLAATRRELNLDGPGPLIGVIANIKPIKGHQYFFEAFQQVSYEYPNARALIVGECFDDWEEKLKLQCRALGIDNRVIFAGLRSDIPEILSTISLFVLPSLSEGMPNAVMEAMVVGAPVVATTVGGTLELITDGKSGLLVPPADSRELARAMIKVISDRDLGVRLAATARQQIGKLHMDRMVHETEALYKRLIEKRPASSSVPYPQSVGSR